LDDKDGTSGKIVEALKIFVLVKGEPVFVQGGLFWTHHLRLGASMNNENWTARVDNPNPESLLWITMQILGLSDTGASAFTVDSGLIQLLPGETRSITLIQPFTSLQAGSKFTFTSTIHWGFDFISLPYTSSSVRTGGFTVAA
jgi:hypothetical protein